MRRAALVLVSAALTLLIAGLARAPWTPPGQDKAWIRFAWRMNIRARETCRPRSPAELEALPVHMRTPDVCTRDVAHYTLITRVDDAAADTIQLIRGGVKGDRPVFVLEERPLAAGQHRIRVELERATADTTEVLGSLDAILTLRPGAIQLITLDPETGRLVARSSSL